MLRNSLVSVVFLSLALFSSVLLCLEEEMEDKPAGYGTVARVGQQEKNERCSILSMKIDTACVLVPCGLMAGLLLPLSTHVYLPIYYTNNVPEN